MTIPIEIGLDDPAQEALGKRNGGGVFPFVVNRHQRAATIGRKQATVAGRVGSGDAQAEDIFQGSIGPPAFAFERDALHACRAPIANAQVGLAIAIHIGQAHIRDTCVLALGIAEQSFEFAVEDEQLLLLRWPIRRSSDALGRRSRSAKS